MPDDGGKPLTSVECASAKSMWQEPSWLAEWRATELPPALPDDIRRSLMLLGEMLCPASEDDLVVALVPLMELFGAPRPEALPRYFEALSDIPAQSLAGAIYRCMRECKFFPAPVEIRERADDFHRLQSAKTRLETALWRIDFEAKRR